jgi:hypothetical protein
MDDEQREIIARVGRGELMPDEAMRMLDALEQRSAATDPGPAPDEDTRTRELPPPVEPPVPPAAGGGPRELRVQAAAGSVRVVGDPTIAGVQVEGAHEMREEGDRLVVECEPLVGLSRRRDHEHGFMIVGSSRHGGLRLPWANGGGVRIRANPDLALDVDVAAGSISIDAMHGPITCDVSGGAARLRDVRGPLTCSVSAGSVSVTGVLRHGDSTVSCDMGSVAVNLEPGSSVRVRTSTTMGKAAVMCGRRDGDEWVVGDGEGSLQLVGAMSSMTVNER